MDVADSKSGQGRNSLPKGISADRFGAPSPEPAWALEGYHIVAELARGGQAIVYKAVQKATHMKVALKVIYPQPTVPARAQRELEREVELVTRLDHPYVVKIHDSGIWKGQYYFAMEYIHGKPLDEYIRSANLALRETMELLHKVSGAIAHAHQRGVIHRDLKPSNILVDERGDPHVLDFGLAKAAGTFGSTDAAGMPSMTGEIKGTLAYMSPEQASGQPERVDVRTDVYSLGVVFYAIVNGQFPYDVTGGITQTLRNIKDAEPARARQLGHKLNPDIEIVLLKCLEKDPNRRYHSAGELYDEIERWLQGICIHARAVSVIYTLRKRLRRHAYASAVLGLLVLILLGFSCSYYLLHRHLQEQNTKLRGTREDWAKAQRFRTRIDSQRAFCDILDVWHSGQGEGARSMCRRLFGDRSREAEALAFLLATEPLAEKEEAFRRRWQVREPFFVTFIIGEHHLRDGNGVEALTALRRSLRHPQHEADELLRWLVHRKIRELERGGTMD